MASRMSKQAGWPFTCLPLSLLLLSLAPTSVLAGPCLQPEAHKDDPHAYLLALVDALGWAKTGRDRVQQSAPTGNSEIAVATELMTDIKIADRDYECAVAYVSPYRTSTIEPIKVSAEGVAVVFTSLVALDKQMIALYKDALDRGPAALQPGSLAEKVADLSAKDDELWKTLTVAVIAATYSITEVDPATGNLGRFSLTEPQRIDILNKIKTTFGRSVENGTQEGQLPLEASVAALHKFISDPRWKTRGSQ